MDLFLVDGLFFMSLRFQLDLMFCQCRVELFCFCFCFFSIIYSSAPKNKIKFHNVFSSSLAHRGVTLVDEIGPPCEERLKWARSQLSFGQHCVTNWTLPGPSNLGKKML